MIKQLVALFGILFFTGVASAQYGTYMYNQRTNQWYWGGSGPGVITQPVVTAPVITQHFVPHGPNHVVIPATAGNPLSAFNKCEVVGGVAGGTVGSLAHNHTWQAVVLGAIAGGWVGNALCTSTSGQQVYVPSTQLRPHLEGRVVRGGNQFQSCTTGGETFQVSSEEQCRRMAMRMSGVSSGGIQGGTQAAPQHQQQGVPQKLQLEASTTPSGTQADSCRLRVRGAVVAEVPVPENIGREQAKSFCDNWQQREARSRGLI